MKTPFIAACLFVAFLSPCALAAENHGQDETAVVRNADGTITYDGEYRFASPPAPWELIRGNETSHFVFGFYRKDPGRARIESTFFAFDEEPYGYSLNIGERAAEFLKRFFWDSYVRVTSVEKKKETVLGGDGLALTIEAKDPVAGTKVRSKVLFGKRGGRVVAFYIRQWRTMDNTYDMSAFETFDKFAGSLRFLHKSFYEGL